MNNKIKVTLLGIAIIFGFTSMVEATPRDCYNRLQACLDSSSPEGKCYKTFELCIGRDNL